MARYALPLMILGTGLLGTGLFVTTCTPKVRDAQFSCDPLVPDPCPAGLICRQLGSDYRCVGTGQSTCGDNHIEPGEQCDGTDFGGRSCADYEKPEGQIICQTDCTVFCTDCGNGRLEMSPDGIGEQCDDGNLTSHDGCASDCKVELPTWQQWQDPLRRGRRGHTLVYDAHEGRTVLFGGESQDGVHNDTWIFDESAWGRLRTDNAPAPRATHGMVYDSTRRRVVLFGGTSDDAILGDTWAFDGRDWSQLWPAHSPPVRQYPAMAYDPQEDQVVLFGGVSWGVHGDTWTFDGQDWTRREPDDAPSARFGASLVYDAARQCMLLFGGVTGSGYANDLWAWQGQQWRRLHTDARPVARAFAQLAYDPLLDQVVLQGGHNTTQYLADVWTFDGDQWRKLSPEARPQGRSQGAAVFDENQGGILLFGGFGPDGWFGDTWTFGGSEWSELAGEGTTPQYGLFAPVAADPWRQEVVIFGGGWGTEFLDSTWVFDGDSWIERQPEVRPPARTASAMAFDAERGRLVLFGGGDAEQLFADTWEYDGQTWTQREVGPGPAGRTFHAMAWDPARRVIVLHGGQRDALFGLDGVLGEELLGDTWTFDGTSWEELPDAGGPATAIHQMAYHGAAGAMALYTPNADPWVSLWELVDGLWTPRDFGFTDQPAMRALPVLTADPFRGTILLSGRQIGVGWTLDLWELNGAAWRELTPFGAPEDLSYPIGVYAPWLGQLVVHGERGDLERVAETWTFGWRSALPDEQCTNGRDDDADGRVDCDDLDCSWHGGCHD